MNEVIQLIQSPVIKHNLEEMGKNVSEKISALNLDKQVATEETLQTLKKTRAELNYESKLFEDQRKAIKEAVLTPYNDFENTYKAEILAKYKDADTILKEKINSFEMELKTQKKKNLEEYFNEICTMMQIDWLTFSRLNIDVNLSTSVKKYKVEIFGTMQKIKDDLSLISTETHAAEILVEYKKSLNASQSIKSVRDRKDAEKIESERLIAERTNKRTASLRSLSMVYHDLTRTYNHINDPSIEVKYSDIENLSDDEWIKTIVDLENKLKPKQTVNNPAPLQAPVVSTSQSAQDSSDDNLHEAKFMVRGTMSKLLALSDFLKDNDYNYENID